MSSETRCSVCDRALDPTCYARCDVCRGARLCVDCARAHLCTPSCASDGCTAGLCVRMVRNGVTEQRFGVTE